MISLTKPVKTSDEVEHLVYFLKQFTKCIVIKICPIVRTTLFSVHNSFSK